jgi:transcriptional regulator with XRE-family HTH domain
MEMDLGKKLKKLRLAAGFTQEQLADKLGNGGYDKSVVAAIENNRRSVGIKLLSTWAEACGYEMEVIFRGKVG